MDIYGWLLLLLILLLLLLLWLIKSHCYYDNPHVNPRFPPILQATQGSAVAKAAKVKAQAPQSRVPMARATKDMGKSWEKCGAKYG